MKQPKSKPHKPYKRKFHIDGEEWSYQGHLFIRIKNSDNTITFNVTAEELLGLSSDAIERSIWKGNNLHNITPGKIKSYVEEKLC